MLGTSFTFLMFILFGQDSPDWQTCLERFAATSRSMKIVRSSLEQRNLKSKDEGLFYVQISSSRFLGIGFLMLSWYHWYPPWCYIIEAAEGDVKRLSEEGEVEEIDGCRWRRLVEPQQIHHVSIRSAPGLVVRTFSHHPGFLWSVNSFWLRETELQQLAVSGLAGCLS